MSSNNVDRPVSPRLPPPVPSLTAAEPITPVGSCTGKINVNARTSVKLRAPKTKVRRSSTSQRAGALLLPKPPQASEASPSSTTESQARVPFRPKLPDQSEAVDEIQRRERQQILDWAEHVYQELARTEQERARLEQTLAASKAENVKLQVEFEKTRRECAELERLAHLGHGAGQAATENGDLRKQLAAYAVEIGVLRQDKESALSSVSQAQQAIQKLTAEKQTQLQVADELRQQLTVCQLECKQLESMHSAERERRKHVEQRLEHNRDAVDVTLQVVQEKNKEEFQKMSESLQAAESAHSEKDARLHGLISVLGESMAIMAELQDNYVEQTKAYHQLSAQVRLQQEQLSKDVLEAEQLALASEQFATELQEILGRARDLSAGSHQLWQQEALQLEEQVKQLREHHRTSAEQVRAYREGEDKRAALEKRKAVQESELAKKQADLVLQKAKRKVERRAILNHPNILQQMAKAMKGTMVEKIDQRGRKELRFLKVICDRRRVSDQGVPRDVPEIQLRWSKAPYREFPDRSSCDLHQVISLGYGHSARAPWLFPNVQPEFCFSVFTPLRSFDFICTSETDAEVFVLVITRLSTRLQGWPLHGGIASASRFQSAKGWCKVQTACRASQSTFTTHLLAAMTRARGEFVARQVSSKSGAIAAPDKGDVESDFNYDEDD